MDKHDAIKNLVEINKFQRLSWREPNSLNEEEGHKAADKILCELLNTLGYSDVVDEWEKVYKWYS